MDSVEFQSILKAEIENAVDYYDSELSESRITSLSYYLGEPFGNEIDGQSQVVASEVSDTIEYIMPSLMSIFSKSGQFARFAPRNPEDVPAAEQATTLVNFIVNNDNNGFVVTHNWFKDALLFKLGVVKAYYDESISTTEETYSDLNPNELAILAADPDVEITAQEVTEALALDPISGMDQITESYSVTVSRKKTSGKITLENIPPEEFIFSRRAKSLDDCTFVAHRTTMSVSDLVAMGYDQKTVEEYAGYYDIQNEEEVQIRYGDIETSALNDEPDPTQRQVLVTESYIRSDYDEDGIAELRRVLSIGESCEILENEPWDVVPFAVLSPVLMPHRMVGRSIAEMIEDIQLIKSTILRQMLDNLYLTNNSRINVVEGQVNIDDLLTSRPGGIVRSRAPGMVQPLNVPQIGSQGFQMLEYMDLVRDQRTGFSKASMGLDPDALQSTTAAAVNATIQTSQSKIEMIARVFAETGCKQLASLLLHLAKRHMTSERIIRIDNQFVPIDPRAWDNDFDLEVTVGLGTGREDEKTAMLTQIASKQEQILQLLGPDNPVTSIPQYVNTLRRIAETAGFKDVDQFFNPPAQILQQLQAQAAQQQQQPQQPDPKVALEREKAMAELELQREKMTAELELKRAEAETKAQIRREEMEMEYQLRLAEAQAGRDISTNLPRG
jgi:hypothetical protein